MRIRLFFSSLVCVILTMVTYPHVVFHFLRALYERVVRQAVALHVLIRFLTGSFLSPDFSSGHFSASVHNLYWVLRIPV